MSHVLSPRALNRALLARQFLLRRTRRSVEEVLEHLIGLQSQAPNPPYFGLWTRIEDFEHDSLSRLLWERSAVRIALMRSTIFLVTGRDALALRPLVQPVMDRGLKGTYGKKLTGVDLQTLQTLTRVWVRERPRTFQELGQLLQEKWTDKEPSALAAAARVVVPLVQVPPRGIWGTGGQAMHTTAESWLGQPLVPDYPLDELILRYLKAFGPATVPDMQVWCGLTRMRDAVERLRPQLRSFVDADGHELFDVPGAELPDADTPAPVRYLAEFDNMLLSYQDRTRIIADEYRSRVFTVNGLIKPTILVDGFVQGLWRIEREKSSATLVVEPFRPLSSRERDALAEEGGKLLDFAAKDAAVRDIRFPS